jgi:hypothetical protein
MVWFILVFMDLFGLAGVDFGPAWDAVSIGGRDDEAPSALGWLLLDFRVDLADKQFGPTYLKPPAGDKANQHGSGINRLNVEDHKPEGCQKNTPPSSEKVTFCKAPWQRYGRRPHPAQRGYYAMPAVSLTGTARLTIEKPFHK